MISPPRKRIGVDLTPVLPGGVNGGAKVFTLNLVRGLRDERPDWDFVVLTSQATHEELAALDAANLWRVCVLGDAVAVSRPGLPVRLGRLAARVFPGRILRPLRRLWDEARERLPLEVPVPRKLGFDLLFSPFTALNYFDPAVPCVSVVYDLQHVFYPGFLSPTERETRNRFFDRVFRRAARVVCISEFVRKTVIEKGGVEPDRVVAIPIALSTRLPASPLARRERTLRDRGLEGIPYVFFPANAWPHKNHRMLLTAFGIYHARFPASRLVLVLTGADVGEGSVLGTAVQRMGLEKMVRMTGFVSDEELADLFAGAAAVVFPSLFEGFGMPVLEAMALGVPVFCSDVTSLPEVAGDAAVYFDPRRPLDIVRALESVEAMSPEERNDRVRAGCDRAARYGSLQTMTRRYVEVLESVLGKPRLVDDLEGRFGDGWAGPLATVSWAAREGPLRLEMEIVAPGYLPHPGVSVEAASDGGANRVRFSVGRGESRAVSIPLDASGGRLEIVASPSFVPAEQGSGSSDHRALCYLLPRAAIVTPQEVTNLIPPGGST